MGFLTKYDGKYVTFKGKKYVIDLDKFKSVCTPITNDFGTREYEISQVYEPDADGELSISSKVEHETKGTGNPQNDMIVYDVVKLLLVSILENDQPEEDFEYDFGTVFALNTLISWGVIKEV